MRCELGLVIEHQRVKLHPMSSRLAGKLPLPVFQESVQLDVVGRMSRPVAPRRRCGPIGLPGTARSMWPKKGIRPIVVRR